MVALVIKKYSLWSASERARSGEDMEIDSASSSTKSTLESGFVRTGVLSFSRMISISALVRLLMYVPSSTRNWILLVLLLGSL